MIFAIPQFALGFFCDFSGNSIYDEWYITFYNMIFTAIAIIYIGAADQDIRFRSYITKKQLQDKQTKYENPIINELGELKSTDDESVLPYLPTRVVRNIKDNIQSYYYISQKNLYFNYIVFFWHLLAGFFQGLIITFFCLVYFQNVQVDSDGHTTDFWFVSFVIYTTLVMAVNALVLIRANHITCLLVSLIILTSVVPYYLFMWFYDHFTFANENSTYSARFALQTWQFYAAVGICVMILIFGEIVKLFGKYYIRPTMVEYTKQLRRKKRLDDPKYFSEKMIATVKKGHVVRLRRKKLYETEQDMKKNKNLMQFVTRGED